MIAPKKQHALPMEEFSIAFDIYCKEGVDADYDAEGIDSAEAGFLHGYLAD